MRVALLHCHTAFSKRKVLYIISL